MTDQLLGFNYHNPVMHVLHRQMKSATADYAKECAKCSNGILWTQQDEATKAFLPEDTCDICGQRYVYMDAAEITRIPKCATSTE